jgi:hypothetical protein
MTRQADTYRPLENIQIPVQIKLAAAWTSFMFLYLYVDHLVLYKPGVVHGILAGMIWEFEVSQTFMIAAFISVAIPAIMILLSMTLPVRVVRVTNLVVASLNIPYAIFMDLLLRSLHWARGAGSGLHPALRLDMAPHALSVHVKHRRCCPQTAATSPRLTHREYMGARRVPR